MNLRQTFFATLAALTLGSDAIAQDGAKPQKPMNYRQALKEAGKNFFTFLPTADSWSVELSNKDDVPVLHISDSCGIQTDYIADENLWAPNLFPTEGERQYFWQGYTWNDKDLSAVKPVTRNLTYTLKDGEMIIDVAHHNHTTGRTDAVQFVMRNEDGSAKNNFFFSGLEIKSATANGWGYQGSVYNEEEGWAYGNLPGETVANLFGTIMESAVNIPTHVLNIKANAAHDDNLPAEANRILYGVTQEVPYPVVKRGRPDAFLATVTPYSLTTDADHISLSWDCLSTRDRSGHTECKLRNEDGNIVVLKQYSVNGKMAKPERTVYHPKKPHPGSLATTGNGKLVEYLSSCEMVEGDDESGLTAIIDALTIERNCTEFKIALD